MWGPFDLFVLLCGEYGDCFCIFSVDDGMQLSLMGTQ